ncbi:MAG: hypothetical protein QXQ53_03800 [Candidatus Methanosuratincola sp.]
MPKVLKQLTHADPQVTLSANTPNVPSTIIRARVPRGLAWIFPGAFPWILKLVTSTGADIDPESKIYFYIRVPSEPDRLWPVGHRILYYPWADLDLAKQFDSDYRDAITVNLNLDILPLVEDEELIVQLISPDTIDTSRIRFYIPYWERTSTEVASELAYRASILRV